MEPRLTEERRKDPPVLLSGKPVIRREPSSGEQVQRCKREEEADEQSDWRTIDNESVSSVAFLFLFLFSRLVLALRFARSSAKQHQVESRIQDSHFPPPEPCLSLVLDLWHGLDGGPRRGGRAVYISRAGSTGLGRGQIILSTTRVMRFAFPFCASEESGTFGPFTRLGRCGSPRHRRQKSGVYRNIPRIRRPTRGGK